MLETPPDTTALLASVETEIAALHARMGGEFAAWLDLVAHFDRLGGARARGFRGTAEWLAWRCDLGSRAAREHVRVARRLGDLQDVRAAMASGELSYSKVRALTRASEFEREEILLEIARESTADELERKVRALRSAASAGLDEAKSTHERRRVHWNWAEDGSLQVFAHLPAEAGAAFIEGIETGAAALGGDPSRSRGARRADALAEIVQSGCPRTQVVLYVDEIALACRATGDERRAGEVCALRDGPAIASETARRLTCDAEVVNPDSGRRRRVVSPALRASLEHRDGGCRWPGCDRRHGTHAHHITHWIHGGPTNRDNLILLCPFHHRLLHEEGFTAEGSAEGVVFRAPDGTVLTDRPAGEVGHNAVGGDQDLRQRAPQSRHGLDRLRSRLRGAARSAGAGP